MPRARNRPASSRRRKKVLKQAKGYWGARSKLYATAKQHVEKGLQYAFRDRRAKKRDFRKLWIARINAAARSNGMTYSTLVASLEKKNVSINRKILADLAVQKPDAFAEVVKFAAA